MGDPQGEGGGEVERGSGEQGRRSSLGPGHAEQDPIAALLRRNRRWADSVARARPSHFAALAEGQSPSLMWIGCCDSRVVPTEVLDLGLGDVFVHTNVANLVKPDEGAVLSALQHAVEVLRVEHVVVCGHTRCAGVEAAVSGSADGPVAEWVRPIREFYATQSAKGVVFGQDSREALDALCRANVVNQVSTLLETEILKRSWERRRAPEVHGWLYRMEDGRIEPLCRRSPEQAPPATSATD